MSQTLASSSRGRRRTGYLVAVIVLVLLALGSWVGVRALSAKRHLEAARASLEAVRTDVTGHDVPAARAALTTAAGDTLRARQLTHDPAWWLLGHLPVAGRSVATVRGLASAADDLTRLVLPGALDALGEISGGRLRTPDGGVDLALLHRIAPALNVAATGSAQVRGRVDTLPSSLLVGPVATARAKLVAQVHDLADALDAAAAAVGVAPALLGEDRPRTYFLLVQQTSETRGTGGLPGGYALLTASAGHLKVVREGSNSDLAPGPVAPPAGVPADYVDRYQQRGGFNDWRNVNLSPDLPVVGRMVASRWVAAHGGVLDGVVALDAQALADLLRGGTPLDVGTATPVAPADLPAYLGAGQYAAFTQTSEQRKESLVVVAHAAAQRLTAGGGDQQALLRGLVDAVSSGHLRMASDDPALAPTLARTGVDGSLPAGAAPVAYPVVFNTAGSKLDYYLRRSLAYHAEGCAGTRRRSTITTRLSSVAPASGLPHYVTIRVVDGVQVDSYVDQVDLSVFATRGARLVSATLDGRPLSSVLGRSDPLLQESSEAGLPIWEVITDVPPGQTRTLTLTLDEPVVPGAARVPEQPLSSPLRTAVDVPRCGSG